MNSYQEVGGYHQNTLITCNCFPTSTNDYDSRQDSDLEHLSQLLLAFLSFHFSNPAPPIPPSKPKIAAQTCDLNKRRAGSSEVQLEEGEKQQCKERQQKQRTS